MRLPHHITGIILAGGKSSRMGTDKGLLPYNGKLFIEHIIDAMRPLTNDMLIVSNNPNYDQFKIPRVEDLIPDAGPLAGVYTGLSHSNTTDNLVLSCDVPLIQTTILTQLISGNDNLHDIIQVASQGKTMPLIALYKKPCSSTFKTLLENGERRLRTAVSHMKTKTIALKPELDPYVKNINNRTQLDAIS